MKTNSHARILPTAWLFLSILTGTAQIPVTSTPVTNRFDTLPPASQWSTRAQAGSGSTIGSMAAADAQAATNAAASVSAQLSSTTGVTPAAAPLAVWSSGGFIQTRPTGNAATLLLATLQNLSGHDTGQLLIRYDFAALSPATEEVPGHRAFYSLSGAANSWELLNSLSGGTAGAKSATLNLTNWTNGTLLHLLWLDDNGSATDTTYQIDNFTVSFAAGPARVGTPPASQSAAPGGAVAFNVVAEGALPIFFQWRKEGSELVNATNATLNFASAQPSDAGDYTVVVSNALGWATSVVATLTVGCAEAAAILTQPTNQFLTHGGTIQLAVTASGTSPLSFQWHRDGTPLAGATNQSFTKPNAVQADSGDYFLIVSNCAAAVTSEVAVVSIPAAPVVLLGLTNTFWKYNQSGADLGTAWREPAYDDSGWPSGRGVLAVEDNALVTPLINTTLSLTGTNGSGTITYYFRTHFTLTNEAAAVQLVSSNLIDDGAVAYLNGTEVFRFNMPNTAVSAGTQASAAAAEGQFFLTNFPPGTVLQGDNVLAVEVHQAGSTSSDIVFGLALFAQPVTPAPPVITEEPANLSIFRGQDANFIVTAESGSLVSYQWFQNGLTIASATNRTFTLTNTALEQAGFYQVILTNAYGATTSRVSTLSVLGEDSRLRLVEFTNAWRFNATGTNLGTIWKTPAYDDSEWPVGQGVLLRSGSSNVPYPERTNTPLPLANGSIVITTYYFRAHFALPPGLSNIVLVTSNLLDDGAVFYLNGSEAGRIRMNGNATATTFADGASSSGQQYELSFLSATNLVAGDNVLAVEVHQSSSTSSDVVFGMNLTAYGAYPQGVLILSPLASQIVPEGSPAEFFADVLGGQPLAYQWFRDGVLLGAETNAGLGIAALHAATAGNYFFIASNSFGSVTSTLAALTVIPDVSAPTLLSAVGTNQLQAILVTFSEPVTAQSATNLANYALAPGVSLLSATLLAPNVVLLTTSGLDLLSDYTLTVSNIFDLADVPNVIAPGTSARVQPNRLRVATGLLQVQTVFIILMENKRWSEIKGSTNAPYLNSLLPQAAYSESYSAPGNLHPSQPNYIWLEAGDHFGHVNDNGPAVSRVTSTNHLSTQLAAAGIEWRGYMESMPYGSVGATNATPYLARHNPFAFFDDVTTNYAYCTNHVRPYDDFAGDLAAGRIGRYNFLTPNITNDMHSFAPGSTSLLKQGDDWLAWELPKILNSAAYSNNGAVIITWDENDYTDDPAIGMIVLSPLAKAGHASTVSYDHSSTLRTMQEIFGVRPYLGAAAGASPLNDLFKDLSLRVAPSNGVAGVWLENVLPGRTNYVQRSVDLLQWTTIQTNTATNCVFIADPAPVPQKFYRAVEIP